MGQIKYKAEDLELLFGTGYLDKKKGVLEELELLEDEDVDKEKE